LKASLNFLALSLVTGPIGTSNRSFDGWIASDVVYLDGKIRHMPKTFMQRPRLNTVVLKFKS